MADTDIKEIIIDRFDGGISEDPRAQVKSQFIFSKHFDIYAAPNRLVPYYDFEQDTNDGVSSTDLKNYDVRDYWFSLLSGRLYGMGVDASNHPKIFYKEDGDQDAGNWTVPGSSTGGAAAKRGSFIEWGTTAALWMFSGTTNVSKCVPGSSFTDTVASVGATISTVAQSIISPKDNNMYMFYNTSAPQAYVVRVTPGASVTDNVVPLPAGYKIVDACLTNEGNIAIAMVSSFGGGIGRSIVIIWDPTLSNFSQIVDFEDGAIKVVANIEGYITAVIDAGMSSTLSPTGGKLAVRMWGGGSVQTPIEIKAYAINSTFLQQKIVKDGRLYFAGSLQYNGAAQRGIWSFGRKTPNSPFAITLAITDENIGSNGIQGFGNAGDYWWLTINADGTVDKINDAKTFTFTSVWESQKFNGGNINQLKELQAVFAMYAALPSAGQVVLKYRKDEESSWTTLFTETTDNAVNTELAQGGSVVLPEFHEIQLRVESTGGAEITSVGFRFYPKDTAATPN